MRTGAFFVLLFLAGAAGVAEARERETSWGKPGVAFVQYWTDAAECALAGASAQTSADAEADLSRSSQADAARVTGAVGASGGAYQSRYGGVEGSVNVNDIMARQRYNEARARRAAQRAQEEAVGRCLRDRGYRQFRLTRDQSAHLATLAEGSRERREYLHQLSADPAVLAAQGL